MFKYSINEVSSLEGFISDWRDKHALKKMSEVSDQDAETMLKKLDTVSDDDFKVIANSKALNSVVTAGELLQYFYKGHFQYIKLLNSTLVPLWKQYGKLTVTDVKESYEKGTWNARILKLEDAMGKLIKKIKGDPIFKIIDSFSYGKKKESLAQRGYDKSSLKSILKMYIQWKQMDIDTLCPSFIFAEDHDEGYAYIRYHVIDQLLEKGAPDGDIEYEDLFYNWWQSEHFFGTIQYAYGEFEKELNFIVKRFSQLIK